MVEEETNTSFIAQIKLNGQDTVFKLDTGTEVSAVTQAICQNLGIHLSESQKALFGPSQTPLKVIGQFQGIFECEGKETMQSVSPKLTGGYQLLKP